MNPSYDIGTESSGGPSGIDPSLGSLPPANWREAVMALIASRFDLIQLESKEIAKGGIRCAIFIAIAAFFAIFAWGLLVAGGISLIAEAGGWAWNWVAIGAAIIHLIAAIILARLAKPSGVGAFPVTRAEFKKDREWIENFQNPKKSND